MGIKDALGNYILGFGSVGASAVNYINIINSASGNPATIESLGSDANVSISIIPKGTGSVHIPSVVDQITTLDAEFAIIWKYSFHQLIRTVISILRQMALDWLPLMGRLV